LAFILLRKRGVFLTVMMTKGKFLGLGPKRGTRKNSLAGEPKSCKFKEDCGEEKGRGASLARSQKRG